MKERNYVTIQGWMVSELGLKGNELLIYAIIYGFSQDSNQWYAGSRKYLSEWTGATKQTVSNYLKSLVEKGYLERRERIDNNVRFFDYRVKNSTRVGEKFTQGGLKIQPGVGEKFTPIINIHNTKDNNIDNNICANDDFTKKEVEEIFDFLWNEYPKKRGKGSVSFKQKKVIAGIGISEMTRCIDRYTAEVKGKEEKYIKNGSTFFNSGYIDYLDANYTPLANRDNDAIMAFLNSED